MNGAERRKDDMFAMRVVMHLLPSDYRRFVLGEHLDWSTSYQVIRLTTRALNRLRNGAQWPEPLMDFICRSSKNPKTKEDFDKWVEDLLSCAPCMVSDPPEMLDFIFGKESEIIVHWCEVDSEFIPPKYKVMTATESGMTIIVITPCSPSGKILYKKEEE
jgi:hypothetical protein